MRLLLIAAFLGLATFAAADGVTDFIIDPASTHVISAPGSYRLAGDVVFTGGAVALEIAADDVTVDLNGHTLRGGAINAGFSLRATIHGGNVIIAAEAGVSADGDGARLSDLRVDSVKMHGIRTGSAARITRCSVRNVSSAPAGPDLLGLGTYGIYAGGGAHIEDCSVEFVTGGRGGDANDGGPGGGAWGIFCGSNSTLLRCETVSVSGGRGGDSDGTFSEAGRGGDARGIQAAFGALVEACTVRDLFPGPAGTADIGGSPGLAIGVQIPDQAVVRQCRISKIAQGIGIRVNGVGTIIENNKLQGAGITNFGIQDVAGGCVVSGNTTIGHNNKSIVLDGDGTLCELNRVQEIIIDNGTNVIGSGANANFGF